MGPTPPAAFLVPLAGARRRRAPASNNKRGPPMTRTLPRRMGIALGAIAVTGTGLIVGAVAQKLTPAEAAARLSGTWTINRELTSGFNAAGRRGGRGGGGNFSLGGNAARFGPTASYAQRGGGTGPSTASDMSDLSPAERAEMAAMRELQQLAEVITIKATAEQVAFEDGRSRPAHLRDRQQKHQNHRRRIRGEHEIAVGQGHPQAGVLDAFEQADSNLGGRRERAPRADGEGGKPSPDDAGAEGSFR